MIFTANTHILHKNFFLEYDPSNNVCRKFLESNWIYIWLGIKWFYQGQFHWQKLQCFLNCGHFGVWVIESKSSSTGRKEIIHSEVLKWVGRYLSCWNMSEWQVLLFTLVKETRNNTLTKIEPWNGRRNFSVQKCVKRRRRLSKFFKMNLRSFHSWLKTYKVWKNSTAVSALKQ